VDTGLTNGTTYYYVVVAVNAAGTSPNSAQVSATPSAPPAAPTNVQAAAGNAQVTLTWNASAGATSYTVQRSTTSGGPYATVPGGSGLAGTSFVDTGLTNGTTYYYVVIAVNGAGSSPNSAQVSATPTAGGAAPAPPTGVVAASITGLIAVAWKPSTSPGVTQNRIYRSTVSGGPYALIGTVAAGSAYPTYNDRTVVAGTTYYYVVTAVNSSGAESGYSNQASATAK
jgi:cellulose 1,4-beta-cellobiosidase